MEVLQANQSNWALSTQWVAEAVTDVKTAKAANAKARKIARRHRQNAKKAGQTGFFYFQLPGADIDDHGLAYCQFSEGEASNLYCAADGFARYSHGQSATALSIGKFLVPQKGIWVVAARHGSMIVYPNGDKLFKDDKRANEHIQLLLNHIETGEVVRLYTNIEDMTWPNNNVAMVSAPLHDILLPTDHSKFDDLKRKSNGSTMLLGLAAIAVLAYLFITQQSNDSDVVEDKVEAPPPPAHEAIPLASLAARACSHSLSEIPPSVPGWQLSSLKCQAGANDVVRAVAEFRKTQDGKTAVFERMEPRLQAVNIALRFAPKQDVAYLERSVQLQKRGVEALMGMNDAIRRLRSDFLSTSSEVKLAAPMSGSKDPITFSFTIPLTPWFLFENPMPGLVLRSVSFEAKRGWTVVGDLYAN